MSEKQERQPVPKDELALILEDMWATAKRERRDTEDEWLKDLRQIRGEYDPEDVRGLQPGQSKAFARLTRAKIKTTDARMMEVLFPGGQRNWEVMPTPEPMISDALKQQILQDVVMEKFERLAADVAALPPEAVEQMAQEGSLPPIEEFADLLAAGQIPEPLMPDEDEMRAAIMEDAAERCERMETEIEDQLTESRYRSKARKVIHSGNSYGIGWLKGPIGETKYIAYWHQTENGWVAERKQIRVPTCEFVPHWDVFVYRADVTDIADAQGIFQRYIMARHELQELGRRDDFDAEKIAAYIAAYPNGDAPELLHHEQELRNENKEDDGRVNPQRENRYEVLEYTGWLHGEDLIDLGLEDIEAYRDYKVNVWRLGTCIIRAVLYWADDPSVQMYHRYVYEEDEVGIYGVGIPRIFRDPQRIFNAALRATMDNARWAKEPVREVNTDLLDPEEAARADEIDAGSTIHRRGTGELARAKAIHFHQVESRINEFMAIMDLGMKLGDEATAIPRYTGGSGYDTGGAAKTASGLSMLMSQSNVVLREPISNYDEVTASFFKAIYHWNMQFNPRDDIKGDYEIHALGSSSLVAKEIYVEQLETFAANTLNDADGMWVKRGELNRERARARNLDPDTFVRSEEEYEQHMMRMMEAQGGRQ